MHYSCALFFHVSLLSFFYVEFFSTLCFFHVEPFSLLYSFYVAFWSSWIISMLHFTCCILSYRNFLCCTLYILHFFHAAVIPCCTLFFVLQSFHVPPFFRVALCLCYTFFVLHFARGALFLCFIFLLVASCCTFFMLHSFYVAPFCYVGLFSCCTFFLLYIFSCSTLFMLQFFHVALFQFGPLLCFPWYPFLLLLFLTLRTIHIALFSHCTMSHPFHVAPFPCSTFLMLHSFHNTLFSGSLQYCTHIMLRSFGLLRLYFFILPLFHVTFFHFFMFHFSCCTLPAIFSNFRKCISKFIFVLRIN